MRRYNCRCPTFLQQMQACGVMKDQRTHANQDKGNMFLKENEYSQHRAFIHPMKGEQFERIELNNSSKQCYYYRRPSHIRTSWDYTLFRYVKCSICEMHRECKQTVGNDHECHNNLQLISPQRDIWEFG